MTQKCLRMSFVSIAFLVLMPLPALTQTPFAPPPQIPYGLSISTESAKNMAAAAIAEAQKNNWKMAIAIVDTGGYLVYFEKMQDTQTGSVELAIEKARTAALFRRPTKVFQDGVAAGGEGLRLYGSPAPFRLMAVCRSSWMAKCSGPSGSRGGAASRTDRWPKRALRALAPSNSKHSLGRTVPCGREVSWGRQSQMATHSRGCAPVGSASKTLWRCPCVPEPQSASSFVLLAFSRRRWASRHSRPEAP